MTDSPGQPEQENRPASLDTETPPDTPQAAQVVSLSTAQAAQQLGVNSRTVRRYITNGILVAGTLRRLPARQVRTDGGQEYQIYQSDLEQFKAERDRAATEGQQAIGLTTRAEESTALATSIQIISEELERRSLELVQAKETIERLSREAGQYAGRNEVLEQSLTQAQGTIERLSREAGQHAGRNEMLEQQLEVLRKQVEVLTQEREQLQQKAKKSYRIRLLPFQED